MLRFESFANWTAGQELHLRFHAEDVASWH
jgi:hypothetical protein